MRKESQGFRLRECAIQVTVTSFPSNCLNACCSDELKLGLSIAEELHPAENIVFSEQTGTRERMVRLHISGAVTLAFSFLKNNGL